MEHFFTASLVLTTLFFGVLGQQCNSGLQKECYYTGAGTISAGNANINKYFAVGGLFDIHQKDGDDYCGSFSDQGMINLLAFYWSVNKYSTSLSGPVTVAAIAFDSCMHPDQTIENVLSFSQCKVQVQGLSQQNLVGYVGPYSNEDAKRTGMLAKDLKIPLISPNANSVDLNQEDQESLLRMRPSMKYDLKAMAGFLRKMNFKNVMIVYSPSPFWKSLYDNLKTVLENDNAICNVYSVSLAGNANDDDFNDVAKRLKDLRRSKFVMPLMSKEMTKKLMQATSLNFDLVYLLNSEIGQNTDFVSQNAIIVEPALPISNDLTDFNTFLSSLQANSSLNSVLRRNDVADPWLQAYTAQGGRFPDLSTSASPLRLTALRTIESVKAFIMGMDQAIKEKCNPTVNYQFCDDLRNLAGRESTIYGYVKGNRFGADAQLLESNILYSYFVYNSNTYTKIGTYKAEGDDVSITADLTAVNFGQAFSGSVCVPDKDTDCCIPPTTTPPSTQAPTTQPAVDTTPKPNENIAVFYPKGKEITGAFADMERTDDEYGTRFDIGQKWILALGVLAGLGVLCVLVFEIFILYKMVGTRMGNKWRTMWLGQLLLFGIFLAYLVCFAYLFIPTKATCGITRFGVGVAYAICFAVLLVKLMVILTSKSSDALIPGDVESPNYLKGVYQFLMFIFAVGVQIVINVQWLITIPPEAVKIMSNAGEKVWVCNHYTWQSDLSMDNMGDLVRTNFENHLLSLTYIMVMILIVTILSLHAHGIITNHRESVFIGIAAGFSIPLWLAWGLVGGLNKDKDYGHEFGDACIAFGLFITATLILFTMFLPKVRQLVNMGVEGIYLEDDRDTIYGGSVIMGPPSYKSKGPSSVIYLNNQGIYSEPVVVGNGDSKFANHLKHPGSTYSAPPTYLKKTDSTYGGSRVLRVTDDLKGRHPSNKNRKPLSEVAYNSSTARPRSHKGTMPRSRSQSDLGAL